MININLGKINKNKVQALIRDLEWKGKTRTEIKSYLDIGTGEYKESKTELTGLYDDIDKKITDFLNLVYKSHNDLINEKNFKEFMLELKAFSVSYKYKINDIRQTKEELLKQRTEREKSQKEAEEKKDKENTEIKASGNLTQSEKISLSTKDISKLIRDKIKAKFNNCVFSVTMESYSMGSSINVYLMKSNFKVIQDFKDISEDTINEYEQRNRITREQLKERQNKGYHQLGGRFNEEYKKGVWSNGVFLTKDGFNLFKEVCKIVNYYNYDNSELMTDYYDVNFYLELRIGKYDKDYIYEESTKPENKPSENIEDIVFKKNEIKNGLEIYFPEKPCEAVRDILKNNGFRWGRFNKCWYKRFSDGLETDIKQALGVV